MSRTSLSIAFVLLMPLGGCAAVLGLDTGTDLGDAGDDGGDGAAASADAAKSDGGSATDTGAPVCAPNTADCNGNPSDGCETPLNNPQHCGSCTTVCQITQSCNASHCCTNDNLICADDTDCCSGKCGGGHKCGH